MVGKLENSVHDATRNFQMRLDTFGEAKKLMNAAFDPIDPLNMHDYEPPHEQAVAALRVKAKEVTDTRSRWTQDLQQLKAANAEAPDSTLSNLTKQADRSSSEHKKACDELESANAQVKQCWYARILLLCSMYVYNICEPRECAEALSPMQGRAHGGATSGK